MASAFCKHAFIDSCSRAYSGKSPGNNSAIAILKLSEQSSAGLVDISAAKALYTMARAINLDIFIYKNY